MNMKKALPILVIASMMLSLIPYTFALPAPVLNVATGNKGTEVHVTGPTGTVPAGTTVQLYWDTTTGAWDGVKGLMNSTTGKASGAYEVWFDVPEATAGAHYVWVKDGDGNTASAPFTVTQKIKNSPSSGLASDTITGTFNGFSGSKDIALVLSTVNPPVATAVVIEVLSLIDGATTEWSGTFAHTYIVPGSIKIGVDGVLQATDDGAGKLIDAAGPLTASGTINYVTGAYTVTFTTAPPTGGTGLRVDYTYWGTSATQWDLGKGTTNSVGSSTVSWKVPTTVISPTSYFLASMDAKGVKVTSTTFNVGPVVTLTPATGAVGDIIHINGRGFVAGTTILEPVLKKTSSGATVNCFRVDTPVTVDVNGRFRLDMVVSGVAKVDDDYTITVTSSGALTAVADFEVTALHTLTVSPVYAPQGSQITVSGTHYSKDVDTVVKVDLETTGGVLVVAIGTAKTLADGTFSKVFTVPAQLENSYKIRAYITTYTTKSTGFRIGTMGIILSSSSGPTGKSLTITGNGFTKSGGWNATIGTKTLVATATADANGLISATTTIPKGIAAGVYTISVLDKAAEIALTAQYTVTYVTSITLDPASAPNLFNVSVTGKGFKYASAGLTFYLYNKTTTGNADYIWSMDVRQNYSPPSVPATVNATGFVTAYWVVPATTTISPGTYYVNATDADGFLAQATFSVSSKHVVITPRKVSFGVGDTISFQLEHTWGKTAPVLNSVLKIYDPSNTLVFQGDALATWIKTGLWYTAPYSTQTAAGNPMVLPDDAPIGNWTYKWVGTDAKNIATGTFKVTSAIASPIQKQITDLATQITDLKTSVTAAAAEAKTAATTAATKADAATAAATAAGVKSDAATAAATAAGTKADAAATAASAAAAAAKSAADSASGLTTLVYAAIGASLIAALAAIVALMQISRKIA
jgi:hypothetical protein